MSESKESEASLYDDSHIIISEIIGRGYYTSIGESGFKEILNFCATSDDALALDIGSGNSNTAIWFARHSRMNIFGVEPLVPLFERAQVTIKTTQFGDRIQVVNSDFFSSDIASNFYDSVFGIDTFCYFEDRLKLLEKVELVLKHDGIVAFTDLVSDNPCNESLRAYLDKYDLSDPLAPQMYRELIIDCGFEILEFSSRIDDFLAHWKSVQADVLRYKKKIIEATNLLAFEQYLESTTVILNAINSGSVDYVFGVLKKSN